MVESKVWVLIPGKLMAVNLLPASPAQLVLNPHCQKGHAFISFFGSFSFLGSSRVFQTWEAQVCYQRGLLREVLRVLKLLVSMLYLMPRFPL